MSVLSEDAIKKKNFLNRGYSFLIRALGLFGAGLFGAGLFGADDLVRGLFGAGTIWCEDYLVPRTIWCRTIWCRTIWCHGLFGANFTGQKRQFMMENFLPKY